MPYDVNEWRKRLLARHDMTFFLTHLTRETDDASAVDVLLKILSDRKIKTSDPREGFIHGNIGAVCFQDVPLQAIASNLIFENEYRKRYGVNKIRYSPCGLQIGKQDIFI